MSAADVLNLILKKVLQGLVVGDAINICNAMLYESPVAEHLPHLVNTTLAHHIKLNITLHCQLQIYFLKQNEHDAFRCISLCGRLMEANL